VKNWFKTIYIVRFPLIAIVLMLSLATLTGTSGIQSTLGLAFAATGKLFPFFSAVLGWLGVAATGSDTSANVLFGGLQVVAAQHAGFNPLLMAAANSTGRLHGQDHRHRLHRHRGGGDRLAGQRGQDSALRPAQRHLDGHAGGPVCDAAGYVYPFTLTVPGLKLSRPNRRKPKAGPSQVRPFVFDPNFGAH